MKALIVPCLVVGGLGYLASDPNPTHEWAGTHGGGSSGPINLQAGQIYMIAAEAFIPRDAGTSYPVSAELWLVGSAQPVWTASRAFAGTGFEGQDRQVLGEVQLDVAGAYELRWNHDVRLDDRNLVVSITELAVPRWASLVLMVPLSIGLAIPLIFATEWIAERGR
jgi:hypothetical protein